MSRLALVNTFRRLMLYRVKLGELNTRIAEHEKEGRYLEAFMIRSAYVESIITIVAVSMSVGGRYDGSHKSYGDAVNSDPLVRKEYAKISKMNLEEKVDLIKDYPGIDASAIRQMHDWRDDWNQFKHWFAEKMMHDTVLPDAEKAYNRVRAVAQAPWFAYIEMAFVATDASHGKSRKRSGSKKKK